MGWLLTTAQFKNAIHHVCRHIPQEDRWPFGPLIACNCGHHWYWLCRFYGSLRWFSGAPCQESLTGGRTVNGCRRLFCALTQCQCQNCLCMLFRACACVWLCASVGNGSLSYYQGNPEIGDSIRVGHVIQGWDPSSVYWLPSHPIRQNISSKPCGLHGLTRSFLDVHPRQTCSYGLNELSRLFQKYGFVRGDLHTLTRSLFFSLYSHPHL